MDLSFAKNSSHPSPDRLRQLSDEVSRIAASLAKLAVAELPDAKSQASAKQLSAVPIDAVRHEIRVRRLRERFFKQRLFADPAWDMLLDLFQAELAQHRVSVSSLCQAAAVPPTTALRWITTMTEEGLFQRRADPLDGRRVIVELTPSASLAMRRYFSDLSRIRVAQ